MVSLPLTRVHDDFAAVYAENVRLVRDVARYRFNVPAPAVDDVVQDVFLSYFLARDSVRDVRSWLMGAACNASRGYWMRHHAQKEEPLPAERPGPGAEEFLRILTVREVVRRLPPRCQRTLKLRYFDGLTARELADQLGTTTGYAQKLVHECLRKAVAEWHHLWREK